MSTARPALAPEEIMADAAAAPVQMESPFPAADLPAGRAGWMQQQLGADELPQTFDQGFTAGRIWMGFMTARVMVALLLLVLQGMTMWLKPESPPWLLPLCISYVAATLATRIWVAPVRLGKAFEVHWPYTVGLDLMFYFVIVWFGRAGLANFLPLLALPPLVCAVLGSWRITVLTALLALGLMTVYNWFVQTGELASPYLFYTQMAVYLLALLALSYVLHRLAQSLGVQQLAAYSNQRLAQLRGRISDLVVQSVPDGVLVVGSSGRIRAINPTAHALLRLGLERAHIPGMLLQAIPQMQSLAHLVQQSFADGEGLTSDVLLLDAGEHPPHLLAHTQLDLAHGAPAGAEDLCLLYLQDMHQLQEQVRTEKLAAMGRMSAAVAHEIRNPLSAIAQAAQLLDEELQQPLQKKLSGMVQSNVQRLGRVVDDVLDIASLQHLPRSAEPLALDATVHQFCQEWLAQNPAATALLRTDWQAAAATVRFDPEHLRRVLINLLDNALRHASPAGAGSIRLGSRIQQGKAELQVWSRGPALEPAVQAHLFEPFVSGHSRSTGLGLYICRELCQRYGADMHYQRREVSVLPPAAAGMPDGVAEADASQAVEAGNAFYLLLPVVALLPAGADPVVEPSP